MQRNRFHALCLCSQKNSTFITKRMSGRRVSVSFVLNAKWGNHVRETSFPSRLNQMRCSRWYFEPHCRPSNATTVQLPQVQHQVVEMDFIIRNKKMSMSSIIIEKITWFTLLIISKIWWCYKFWDNYEEVKLWGDNFILPIHFKNLILLFVKLSMVSNDALELESTGGVKGLNLYFGSDIWKWTVRPP